LNGYNIQHMYFMAISEPQTNLSRSATESSMLVVSLLHTGEELLCAVYSKYRVLFILLD